MKMKKMKKILPACVLSLSLLGTTVSAAPPEHANHENRYIPVQLLGINDFHGQLDVYRTVGGKQVGGAEYLAAYLKKYEQENKNTLLVQVGDALERALPFHPFYRMNPPLNF